MTNAKIIATGSYVPEKILNNLELEAMVDTKDDWIVSRTGIKERRICGEGEKSSDLSYKACLEAIKCAPIDKSEIDMMILATSSSDITIPSTGCILQNMLGLSNNIPVYDLQAACSGFLYGLSSANAYIKSGKYKNILVVGADTVSKFTNYSDRNTCILFGDGAGCVILQATNEDVGIIDCDIYADSSGISSLYAEGRVFNGKIIGDPYIKMDGQVVFKMAVKNLTQSALSILSKNGYNKEQISWFIPHQANIRIIEAIAHNLSIPIEKVIITVDKHGNTSAASVPLALDFAVKNGKIKRGDLLLLEAVGAGFTWGACLIRY